MYGVHLPRKPQRLLILGSGGLQIGQAGEFDYSGSQAIKAIKEEGIYTVLINPNIATIQTSEELADRIYLIAVTPEFVEEIIVKENIDSILLSFGGQTALNCGLALHDQGILEQHGVKVLGTPIDSIRDTEDRQLFIDRLNEISVKTARSQACNNIAEAQQAVQNIGIPVMLRVAYALGGKGSGIVETQDQLDHALRRAFSDGAQQVLVEECLKGWKEVEYEVVRDLRDNCITVCNMENFDPVGIHTGESIVVAPSQTLNDHEYQKLRTIALKTIRHLGIVGECNIQYALDPKSSDYRVIEVNARLSRSSALASKATGYPLAYVAAKLAIGYSLADLPNGVTRCTSAFFEPSLDYLVCKVPRWDLAKFEGASTRIGSEMKSVGEVMAIGRTFPEVIQKALRMLDIGANGLDQNAFQFDDLDYELANASSLRIFAIVIALHEGYSVEKIHSLTLIDNWFLNAIDTVVSKQKTLLKERYPLSKASLVEAKKLGFSDQGLADVLSIPAEQIRALRLQLEVTSHIAQIDTLAAEFPAETNYLYSTYHASASDITPSKRKKIIVLGSGAYRIGSSVEFDWCCVNAIKAIAELGYETIMINFNPETVSTDYDVCDKLLFDEISLETVVDLYNREQADGVVISVGGQLPNNLALGLQQAGVNILGTLPENIDRAEDRSKFSSLLDELNIDQPLWAHATDSENIDSIVEQLGGYPVLVRPSYVLSGAAMSVAHERNELKRILTRAVDISPLHPVVVSKFETHAREIEIDAVADNGKLVMWSISEHIEDAGVHSGDATLVLPPQTLYISTIRRVRKIAAQLAEALAITGPFNAQFLAKHNAVKVIECNLRASRSFPFVSKVTGQNYAAEAARRMLGAGNNTFNNTLELDHVGVKAPMFSFARITGADPMLGVEMASTGEVGCIGDDLHEALLHALIAAGFKIPKNGVLLSLGKTVDKYWFTDEAKVIAEELNLPIYATEGTAEMLNDIGIPCTPVGKTRQDAVSALDMIENGQVDLVINIPRSYDDQGRPDGYYIRRQAVEAGVALLTDLPLARAVIEALKYKKPGTLPIKAWNDYLRIDKNLHKQTL